MSDSMDGAKDQLAATIQAIEAGPKGSRVGAFFDLDGTLVGGFTASALYKHRLRTGDLSPADLARTLVTVIDGEFFSGSHDKLAEVAAAGLKGRREDELTEVGEHVFVQETAGTIRSQARDLVRAHLRMGHTVAVASSATKYQIDPIARDLGIPNVLCTMLAVTGDGTLTGELDGPMLWGQPKADAVTKFAKSKRVDLKRSYAYANGSEDVAFLSSVAHPTAITPHSGLRAEAQKQGWPILMLAGPQKAGLRSIARTAAAIGGMQASLLVGAGLGLLQGDRRLGVNFGIGTGCDAALALTGVKLNVTGEEHAWSSRPAIFVANHQSSLDMLIAGSLLRRDLTGVAKREAKYDPRMLIAGLLVDPAYINRSDSKQARGELDELMERIHGGTSILIFPEGTRAPTINLGAFKKGAFHIARQAGVPIVPIVIRNAGELMWRRSKVVNPGTVDVCVLPPIPTDGWKPEEVGDHAAAIRQQFIDTLDRWPR